MSYPPAVRLDIEEHRHGQVIPDPYRWLEDAADPRTVQWLAQQRELFLAHRDGWSGRGHWEGALAKLTGISRALIPKARGERIFVRRLDAGSDHPVLLVREGAAERVLLDAGAMDPSGRTVVEAWEPSLDGHLLSYQVSCGGTENSLLWVIDVSSGQVVDGPIDRVRHSPIGWLPGSQSFYYVRRLPPEMHPGEERYHRRVYLHRVGSDPAHDVVVFGEGRGATQSYDVDVSPDGRWLSVAATAGADRSTDLYLADLSQGPVSHPVLRPVQEDTASHTVAHFAPGTERCEAVWLRTDHGAPRGRVAVCDPALPAPASWRELIAERPDAVLVDFLALTGPDLERPIGLASWTRHAVAEITVHDLTDGRCLSQVPLPGLGSAGPFSRHPDGHGAWVLYTDHRTAPVVLSFDGRTGLIGPWEQARPAADDGVTICQQEFASSDGTLVRMFVISATGYPDRPRPGILDGYGGFGASMTPVFAPGALAWAMAGGIYAIACLRGGGEEGSSWHQDGRGLRKQNVFDDFAAAADSLVGSGWTSPGQLGIMGGSNGGLLIGAALTQHPQKYAAAVCMAPVLDMVRYELSGLGPSWVPEYGSTDDPSHFANLLSYSPYHRVTRGTAYPPVLFTVSDGDTRVDPLHARKMCAALQDASVGPGPVLLRVDHGTGHGTRAVSSAIALQADSLAFLADRLGLVQDWSRSTQHLTGGATA